VSATIRDGVATPDIAMPGARRSTTAEVTAAILARLGD
jgi:hypothetical protein